MEETSQRSGLGIRALKLILKIVVTIVCLWYVSTKIDLHALGNIIASANWIYVVAAALIFILSKIVASYRLNIYFKNIGLDLHQKDNLRLFWLGMFYNLFLPGSITGDAYKVILLSKQFDISYRKTMSAVVLDRFSGLLALGILVAIYSLPALGHNNYKILLIIAAILSVFIFYFITRRYFKSFLPGFWQTFFLGFFVQALMVSCIYFIMMSLGIYSNQSQYVFIFLIAAVAGVLPLTVGGGLGIREFVFYKGAIYFGLDEHSSITISLLFYFVTLVTSLFGAIYIFRPIFADKKADTNTRDKFIA